jgi:ABC-type multidrug transport system ATPase subunit
MLCLEWQNVWARYDRRYDRRWALRDVSLGVEALQTLCLVGPAGGGKTALLRVAEGSLRAEAGAAWVNGLPARRARGRLLRSDEPLVPALTVERQMEHRLHRAGVRGRHLDRRLRTALRTWEIEAWREARIGALSTSAHQRVRLAVQWACPGAAWLLDNPTSLLECTWREQLPALLSAWREREDGAVVVATNIPDEAATADRIAILHQGRVVACGPPAQLCRVSGAEEIVVRTVDNRAAAAALSAQLRLEAERRPDGLLLRVRHADDTLPGVLQTLGRALETLWVRRPTLQDAIAYHTALPIPSDLPTQPPRK